MTKYELLVTLPGTLDEKEASQHIDEVANLIKTYDPEAQLVNLGKIRLAFPIKQIRYGYFYTLIFNAEPQNTPDINEKLRLRNDLLRYSINYFNEKAAAGKKLLRQAALRAVELEKASEPTTAETVAVVATTAAPAVAPIESAPITERPAISAPAVKPKRAKTAKKIDLKDIGDKLDEILNSDIVSGV